MSTLRSLFIFIIITSLFTHCKKEDTIKIPDKSFLECLIQLGIDTDGSGQISYIEAAAITNLVISNKAIRDLKGIEAFVNLKLLDCTNNILGNINFSNNSALQTLLIGGNLLSSLDVSNNPALEMHNLAQNGQ